MKQEFSLAHLTVLGCAPPETIYIAARAGYEDYASLRPIYMGLPGEPDYSLADKPQMLRQTKAALAATGVRVHDQRVRPFIEAKGYSNIDPNLLREAVLSLRERVKTLVEMADLSEFYFSEELFMMRKRLGSF